MVRAPCCEKMGLKRGSWSPEEDQILIAHIQKHGHGNWRALPKQAGLLRCGKSCRLRWMNYLRPDIKRGNFTGEEEDTIIRLHEKLGNKWSAIAASLPGRTDNEIKNVWHTHLKKRLRGNRKDINLGTKKSPSVLPKCNAGSGTKKADALKSETFENIQRLSSVMSPQPTSSDISAITDASHAVIKEEVMETSMESFPQTDKSFWSDDAILGDTSSVPKDSQKLPDESHFPTASDVQFPAVSSVRDGSQPQEEFDITYTDLGSSSLSSIEGVNDFWCDLFINYDELSESPEN